MSEELVDSWMIVGESLFGDVGQGSLQHWTHGYGGQEAGVSRQWQIRLTIARYQIVSRLEIARSMDLTYIACSWI